MSPEWFQAVISEADPTWVTLLLEEISAEDLRHLGTFVVGVTREERKGEVDGMETGEREMGR